MAAVGAWIKEQRAIFFDNAPARKDFRIQLRGSRMMFQWAVFLILITLFVYFAYSTITNGGRERISLQSAQSQLQDVYQSMLAVLGAMVCLIAPAIGATSVVVERQRRFLDLLVASPMSGRYYLTGKLISSYRNIWMLLMLSLPVVAVGAVMGGATYGDVFKTFLVISLDGVIFSSVALAISAGAQKLPSALVMSYLCTLLLILGSSYVASFAMFGHVMMPGGGPQEMTVLGMLSPFASAAAADTVTSFAGLEIPNWLLFIPLAILAVELCLLGGVSALATKTVRATVWFRVLALALVGLLSFSLIGMSRGMSAPDPSQNLVAPMAFMGFIVPFLACFVADGPTKFTYDGGPKLRNTFKAVPSGSIFYIGCLVLAVLCGAVIGLEVHGDLRFLTSVASYVVYLGGIYALVWAMCRWTSQFAGTLTSARGLATVLVLISLAFVHLVMDVFLGDSLQVFAPLSVLASPDPWRAFGWGVVLLVLAAALSLVKLRRFSAMLVENG